LPEQEIDRERERQARYRELNPYGFKASFTPTYQHGATHKAGWVSPFHFGINEGPTVIMIDNHLHDFTWTLMKSNSYLVAGLRTAGFRGGWLDQPLPSDPVSTTLHESKHADKP
jgi:hypothetical protein